MPVEELTIHDGRGLSLTSSKDAPNMIALIILVLKRCGVINDQYHRHFDWSSTSRSESKYGIGMKIGEDKLFYLFKDKGIIELAETPREILEIGRRGRELIDKRLNKKTK
ncbi:MAG: hypothetical protein CL582_23185 [Alteromonadaceae bacterium]|nr:hypothetical protein [Alteromonadaceae bacterium]